MYSVQFIFNDYKKFSVEVNDEDINDFIDSIQQGKAYFDEKKDVGFWLPLENLRCAYISKLTQLQEEPCQNNPILEAENVSPS
jgi:hypothetical protein